MPRDISITLGEKEALLREGLYDALHAAVASLRASGAERGPVVDVGAGRGELLGRLSAAGIECIGLDPEAECVAAASRHGRCERGGVEDLPRLLGGRTPSVVVCSHVLEHLFDPAGALRAMRATGADGFVFAVPNVLRPVRMLRAAGGGRPDHPAHVFGWARPEFEALLSATGFAVRRWRTDRVTVNPFQGRAGQWLTRRLRPVEERWLPRIAPGLASSLIAECRRTEAQ